MTTAYALLIGRCGLDHEAAAALHGVRRDTVSSWAAGRNPARPFAVDQLRGLYARMEAAAAEAAAAAAALLDNGEVELGLSADNREAQSMGWPSVGVHTAVLGMVVAKLGVAVRVVPRGSTKATAVAVASRA